MFLFEIINWHVAMLYFNFFIELTSVKVNIFFLRLNILDKIIKKIQHELVK